MTLATGMQKPTIIQLGDYPAPEASWNALYQDAGSILRFPDASALLDPHFAGKKLKVQGLLCGIHHKLSPTHFEQLPDLRVISNYGAGLDHLPLELIRQRGILLCNTPDLLVDATADLTMALLLAVQRRLWPAQQLLKEGHFEGWLPDFALAPGLTGKTLGLVGFGNLGQAVAKRAFAFGMRVLYTKRTPLSSEQEASFGLVAGQAYFSLEALLPQCDVVSLHCPLTPETRHLINHERLGQMPRGSSLINTSRGPVVEEAALVEALKSRHLAGAGLDVFENEPAVHPELWKQDNVVLVPHIGSATYATREAMGQRMLENLLLGLAGKKPVSPVDL